LGLASTAAPRYLKEAASRSKHIRETINGSFVWHYGKPRPTDFIHYACTIQKGDFFFLIEFCVYLFVSFFIFI